MLQFTAEFDGGAGMRSRCLSLRLLVTETKAGEARRTMEGEAAGVVKGRRRSFVLGASGVSVCFKERIQRVEIGRAHV